MSFVKYDPSSPNHMVIIEDTHYQCYNGYKIGDRVYRIREKYEPYTICDLKTYENKFEISVNSPWMQSNRQGATLVAHTYEDVDFKNVFITEKQMRKIKIKNLTQWKNQENKEEKN